MRRRGGVLDTCEYVSQNDRHESQEARDAEAGQATEAGGVPILQEAVQYPRTARSSSPVFEEAEMRRRSC
jgi:hypothetical protein